MAEKLPLQTPVQTGNQKYSNWTKEQLIDEVVRLRKHKKYGLVWEDKLEDVVEQCKTELPVLKEVKNRAIAKDKGGPMNILIEGDNYHALSVLNYTHKGKIDVIYIDPPYNTGNKDFKYNDHWVDKEDTYRHSKWVSFMKKRLTLARTLLKKTGVIFVSIDDNELAQLKLICTDVFGENNVEVMIWRKVGEGDAGAGRMKITYRFRVEHEYIIACYINREIVRFSKTLELPSFKNEYKNLDNDPRGPYKAGNMSKNEESSNRDGKNYYIVKSPAGKRFSRQWHFDQKMFNELNKEGRIYWGKKGDSVPSIKIFINELRPTTPLSLLLEKGSATSANKLLEEMFSGRVFDNPKPVELIDYLLSISSKNDAIILDFFAGTGTTGHAVLQLNNRDRGHRQFILCTNNENNIATDVCYPRIAKVIEGYTSAKRKRVAGISGNLKYFRTAFVGAEPNDKNKEALTKQATEMLCMREDTFEPVKETTVVKIFKNQEKHTGIVFDEDAIRALKKEIIKIGSMWSVYIFSLSDDVFEDEFEGMKQKITVAPIPEAILRVYRRLFKP